MCVLPVQQSLQTENKFRYIEALVQCSRLKNTSSGNHTSEVEHYRLAGSLLGNHMMLSSLLLGLATNHMAEEPQHLKSQQHQYSSIELSLPS